MKRWAILMIGGLVICSLVSCGKADGANNEAINKEESNVSEQVDNKEDNASEKINNKEEKDKTMDEESEEDIQEEDNDEGAEVTVTQEKVGSLLSIGNCAVEVFGGDENAAKTYAETISDYAEKLEGKDVYNIIVPSHIEFALPKKYSDLSKSQKDNIEIIKDNESEKVKFVNIYNALKKHKDEYIYFNTDHHWTALGAYYAYCEFAKEAGFEPIDIKDYEAKRKENFLGTFYASAKDPALAENPDYVEYYSVGADSKAWLYKNSIEEEPAFTTVYAEYAEGVNSYGVFLHGDNPLMKIENPENTSGKKAVVVKESYGNAFAPFLIPHYSEVYVVDLRYFNNNLINFVNENEINDVVFINNVFAANTMTHIEKLKAMKQ